MTIPVDTLSKTETIPRLLGDLEKYAGWLGHGVGPTRVRVDVKALGTVIENGCDIEAAVETLQRDVRRVEPGDVLELLDKTIRQLRLALGEGAAT